MPKRLLQKYLPSKEQLAERKSLQKLGNILDLPGVWQFSRQSTARAASVGLFSAMIPLPTQMIIAASLAIYFRCNLPVAVTLVWITNPITIPAFCYLAYEIGAILLKLPRGHFHFEFSMHWLTQQMAEIWQPFLLGCLVMGITLAIIGNIIVRLLWRLWVIREKSSRNKCRQSKSADSACSEINKK